MTRQTRRSHTATTGAAAASATSRRIAGRTARGRRRALLGLALLAGLALPAAAQANGAPKATTGNAREVSYASATLPGR